MSALGFLLDCDSSAFQALLCSSGPHHGWIPSGGKQDKYPQYCHNCFLSSLIFVQLFLQSEMVDMAIAVGGAVVFGLFIIFDTHMIMKKVTPEEYIHASVNLYLDIINLFLHILRALGDRRN